MKTCQQWRGVGLAVLTGVALALASSCSRNESTDTDTNASVKPVAAEVPAPRLRRTKATPSANQVTVMEVATTKATRSKPAAASRAGGTGTSAQPAGSSEVAQQVAARFLQIDPKQPLTAQQAGELNQMFRQLREQGTAALPAIQALLQRNEDIDFDSIPGGDKVEAGSLRLGLIDTLGQIGGAAAATVAVQTLQGTADPFEIAMLTRTLETEAPGQFREQEQAAAREALLQIANGQTKAGNISALFETLQAVGDANTLETLKQAVPQWNYYATLALAGLPGGAGIPTLIDLAKDPKIAGMGIGDFALRPLAQVAVQYPDAAQALIDQARLNKIPDSAWPTVVSALAGTYIQYGNQIFGTTAPPADWTAEEINRRMAILNQMLAVTGNGPARQAIQTALIGLSRRIPK